MRILKTALILLLVLCASIPGALAQGELVPYTLPPLMAKATLDTSDSPTRRFVFEDGIVNNAMSAKVVGAESAQWLVENYGFTLVDQLTLADTSASVEMVWFLDHPQGTSRFYYDFQPETAAHLLISLSFSKTGDSTSLEIMVTDTMPFLYLPPLDAVLFEEEDPAEKE